MSEEIEDNYEELYKQGFNGETEVSEDDTEYLEQPTEEEEVQPDEELDEVTEEATEDEEEDSKDSETDEPEEESDSEQEPYMVIERFGEKINLTKDEAMKMSQLGWDYTSKTQDLATHRKRLEIIEGLPDEVLQALKDTSGGNIEAFATIANQYNIDPYDVDGAGEYKPTIIEKNYELEDIVNDIKSDATNSSTMDTWLNELPNNVTDVFTSNPKILKGLHIDLKNGIAKNIMPEVIKTMKLNPSADFVETYRNIGSRVVSAKKEEVKPEVSREKKKKAVPSKVKTSKHLSDHKSIWDDNDLFTQMRRKAGIIN